MHLGSSGLLQPEGLISLSEMQFHTSCNIYLLMGCLILSKINSAKSTCNHMHTGACGMSALSYLAFGSSPQMPHLRLAS